MVDVTVRGAQDLERIARRLKEAGNGELRKELLRGLRNGAKPLTTEVKESARRELPSGGGLAAEIARSRVSLRTRLTAGRAGVSIVASSRRSLRQLNAGRLRHPVHGHRDRWVTQRVPVGWFSDPIEAGAPKVREALQDVMGDIARKIERGV